MKKYRGLANQKTILYILIVLLSFTVFYIIHGISILNPLYVDWLLNRGDATQNYIGAEAYRQSAWLFPIGRLNTLRYPATSSIIFTDSIPVMAVLYKIIGPILPEQFQYVGIWTLICYILQGLLAAKLLSRYEKQPAIIFLGTFFFLISPVMIYRFDRHWSLGGQWIILLTAMIPVYYEPKYKNLKKLIPLTAAIGFLTPAIHTYFCIECGLIIFSFCIYDFVKTRKIYRPIITLMVFIGSAAFSVFILGGFGENEIKAGGLGYYSFNLNGFINSFNNSSLLPELAHGEGQYEGFSYLGLGMLALVAVSICGLGIKRIRERIKCNRSAWIVILIFALISIIISASDKITMGNTEIVHLPLPQALIDVWALFRSTGRLIWPLYYGIMFAAIIGLTKIIRSKTWCIILLVICLAVQCFDLYPLYSGGYIEGGKVYKSPLKQAKWEQLVEDNGIKHIVLIGEDNKFKKQYAFGIFAIRHKLTMNRFRMSHGQYPYMQEVYDSILSDEKDNLYVFIHEDDANEFLESDLDFSVIDGYIVGIKTENDEM